MRTVSRCAAWWFLSVTMAATGAMLGGCSEQATEVMPSRSKWTSPAQFAPATPVGRASSGRVIVASWYGGTFEGRRTANGEIFNPHALTAASRHFPIGSRVRVTNPQNARCVVVRINDHGPFVGGRELDLSAAAARRLGMSRQGVTPVSVTRLSEPSAGASCTWHGSIRHRRKRHINRAVDEI